MRPAGRADATMLRERRSDPVAPLPVVLCCADDLLPKVRYVFDTLFMAAGVPLVYRDAAPAAGPWLLYGDPRESSPALGRCLAVPHCPDSWRLFAGDADADGAVSVDGLVAVRLGGTAVARAAVSVPFDIACNAFFFLSSWSERRRRTRGETRSLYADSVFARLGIPQDIVDRYLDRLVRALNALCADLGVPGWPPLEWPGGTSHALVLSHDVDFLPSGPIDQLRQGAKTLLRHLLVERDPVDAAKAAARLAGALVRGRDAYGCVPLLIEHERKLGVRASFQVAVGRRHRNDVTYRIEDDRVRDYLRAIPEAGFDLCLHGSYRSTEDRAWYVGEAELLAQRLARPLGSRQHFLSFDYDVLFSAQERAGIQYDMSMGFPDRTGPRAGFSYPYFPYCLDEDRPYDVLQISLFLMDVTLRSYMKLKGAAAWRAVQGAIDDLRRKRGCVSVVWHPIVFGGARDPGSDRLFWAMVEHVRSHGGLATDGRTINDDWRRRAGQYASFA